MDTVRIRLSKIGKGMILKYNKIKKENPSLTYGSKIFQQTNNNILIRLLEAKMTSRGEII